MHEHRHRLDASVEASGPRDFTVRLPRRSSSTERRPPHPAPNVRDDRETPLFEGAGRAGFCWCFGGAINRATCGKLTRRAISSRSCEKAGKSTHPKIPDQFPRREVWRRRVGRDERWPPFVRPPEQSCLYSATPVLSQHPALFPSWFFGTSTGSWRRIAHRSKR